mmetsp:Transcript_11505/g.20694  ORF Transcript_11505/g.20694 Transcript_11505/m.20694 type:complete len:128 (-) Transcript_11505:459-842(-)|eukprot:CAMPEP_0201608658 /NCGR_PEP_ID=MMETSP0492-20130828/8540_1 /ASSEMBLY_ACC=CAM_ASM_000837 /TAXON_ID=420259 /ORGANISM="Thalassiosira gravida, Strain GMp14c1" /LENGTH=127 /DNA_ID=CAMNT_0048073555 /DNA_START=42 /DNA_END=425 /DNA_ORIENTATION=-
MSTPRLSSSGNVVSDTNDDEQPILMEAKLIEMIASLRQLIHSNEQLEEALRDECHDDDDLMQALRENDDVIARKRGGARVLAMKLSRHGVNISLVDKIPRYDGSLLLKEMKEKQQHDNTQNSGGLYL